MDMSSPTSRGPETASTSSYTGQSVGATSYTGRASQPAPSPVVANGILLPSVTWSAVIGGACTAAAISLVLLTLGSGIGLASVSPWANANPGTALTIGAVIWLVLTQWIAAALGGYLTGRMHNLPTRETYFGEAAHGFLSWAVATIFTAYVFAAGATTLVKGSAQAAATIAAAAQPVGGPNSVTDPTNYYVDSLFRSNDPNFVMTNELRNETKRILLRNMSNREFLASDKAYLTQLVSARVGVPPIEAARRVDYVIADVSATEAQARQAADVARQAGSRFSLFMSLAMLIGAAIACAAAVYGGRQKDTVRA